MESVLNICPRGTGLRRDNEHLTQNIGSNAVMVASSEMDGFVYR